MEIVKQSKRKKRLEQRVSEGTGTTRYHLVIICFLSGDTSKQAVKNPRVKVKGGAKLTCSNPSLL